MTIRPSQMGHHKNDKAGVNSRGHHQSNHNIHSNESDFSTGKKSKTMGAGYHRHITEQDNSGTKDKLKETSQYEVDSSMIPSNYKLNNDPSH